MFDAIKELFTERNEDSMFIKYEGSYDYWVDVKMEGDLPYQTTTIMINCYESSDKKVEVPFECKWYRIVNDRNYEIKANGNSFYYKSNPYDIGNLVKVAIRPINTHVGELSFVTFGVIDLDPALKPYIEHHLLSCQGSFKFELLKYDQQEIVDMSDHGNVIEFQATKMGVIFAENFNEFRDFSVDLFTKGMSIKCDYDDERMLTLCFKRGEEDHISASILGNSILMSNLQRRTVTYSRMGYSQMMSMEEDGKSRIVRKAKQKGGFLNFDPKTEEEVDPRELFELSIRFENRILRDSFITSIRFMRVKDSLPMQEIFQSVDVILRNQWFPEDYEDRCFHYVSGCFEVEAFRTILKRMVRINKNLHLENDTLNQSADALEEDLSCSVKEFKDLIAHLRKRNKTNQLGKYEVVKKSLIDTSAKIEKMRENTGNRTTRKEQQKKAKAGVNVDEVIKMEKELKSRKKLNKMLLNEIEKLKLGKEEKGRQVNLGDQSFNPFMDPNPFKEEAHNLNKTMMNRDKGEKYLIGLEEDLKKEINPFAFTGEEEADDGNEEQKQEIAYLKKRINANEQCYEQLEKMIQEIKEGGDGEIDFTQFYDKENLKKFGLESMENMAIGDIQGRLHAINSSVDDKHMDFDSNRFTFAAVQSFNQSNYLGESNLDNPFKTETVEDFDKDLAGGSELEGRIGELRKERLRLSNAGESYGHQIEDYESKLKEFEAKREEKRLEKEGKVRRVEDLKRRMEELRGDIDRMESEKIEDKNDDGQEEEKKEDEGSIVEEEQPAAKEKEVQEEVQEEIQEEVKEEGELPAEVVEEDTGADADQSNLGEEEANERPDVEIGENQVQPEDQLVEEDQVEDNVGEAQEGDKAAITEAEEQKIEEPIQEVEENNTEEQEEINENDTKEVQAGQEEQEEEQANEPEQDNNANQEEEMETPGQNNDNDQLGQPEKQED